MDNIYNDFYVMESSDDAETHNKLRKLEADEKAEKELLMKQAKRRIRRRKLANIALGASAITAAGLGIKKYKTDTDQLKSEIQSRDEKLKKAAKMLRKQHDRMGQMREKYNKMESDNDSIQQLQSQLDKARRNSALRKKLNKEYIDIIQQNVDSATAKRELSRVKSLYKNSNS